MSTGARSAIKQTEAVMRTWTFKEASDGFDQLLDAAMSCPQKIVYGEKKFVIVSAEE
jgi:hypothetical protein